LLYFNANYLYLKKSTRIYANVIYCNHLNNKIWKE